MTSILALLLFCVSPWTGAAFAAGTDETPAARAARKK